MKNLLMGGQWLFALLLALWGVIPARAQSADDPFIATLGELREASYSDKATIVPKLTYTTLRAAWRVSQSCSSLGREG